MPEYTKKDFGGFDLSDIFTYDPDTGVVRHNPNRPANSFKTVQGYNRWLTSYSGKEAGNAERKGHLRTKVTINEVVYKEHNHRIALYLSGIIIPDGMWVDHIDGDPSNNRLDNLRVVTNQDNTKNRRIPSHNTSGVMGVVWDKSREKWRSQIGVGGKVVKLGRYADKDEAIRVRKQAEVKYGFHVNHGRD